MKMKQRNNEYNERANEAHNIYNLETQNSFNVLGNSEMNNRINDDNASIDEDYTTTGAENNVSNTSRNITQKISIKSKYIPPITIKWNRISIILPLLSA